MKPIVFDEDVTAPEQFVYGEALVVAGPTPEERALAEDAAAFVARARAFTITTPETFEEAGRIIEALKAKKRGIVEWFEPMASAAHAAWKAITARRAGVVDPIDEATAILATKYATFAREAKRAAEEERRRLEREAQERERARLQAEADALAAEAEANRLAAAAAGTIAEAAALSAEAHHLQETADAVRLEAATAPAPVIPVQPAVNLATGPQVRANWTYEVIDKAALVRAVAAGVVSLEAVDPSGSYLLKRAKADKDTATIPGVRVYDAGSVASRGRR